ncbi:MAG: hypothetical protein JWP12_1994 [Bacteroidetes bacterium]|nr:hypothetical protein [Bacteroidota bacterium]
MKTLRLTALLFLLFSGVFGVSVFNHHLQLNADSKVTGYVVSQPPILSDSSTVFDKTIPPLDDNDLLADDSLDDDDDGYFSPREKISAEVSTCVDATPYYNLHHFSNDLKFRSYHTNFYYPHCSFISLRVFRL